MKETKELFEKAVLLKNFDEQSYQELVSLRNSLSELINKISIAKRNGYYFECGPELPSYITQRETCYDEIFIDDMEINPDHLNLSSCAQENVLSLKKNIHDINH